MQKVLKIRLRMSSVVVTPVISSMTEGGVEIQQEHFVGDLVVYGLDGRVEGGLRLSY